MINISNMSDNLSKNPNILRKTVVISNINAGFIEIPGKITLNLYVQGCKNNCKGCQNPDLLPFSGGKEVTEEHIKVILKTKRLPEWICWLGGDATFQPEGFKAFNKLFHELGYPVCLYTGQKFNDIQDLLNDVDLVIDGKWEGIPVTEENTNQKVYLKKNNEWINVKKFIDLKEIIGK